MLYTKFSKCELLLEQVQVSWAYSSQRRNTRRLNKYRGYNELRKAKDPTNVKKNLRLEGYYQGIIQDFSRITTPLT